jgi:Cu+-exporting ATPase
MTTDPVCGMSIDANNAADKSEYQGKTLYFCCPSCKQQFDQNPQTYMKQQAAKQ